MRDRDDFIENLWAARIHLLILTEDIKYPLSDERQKWLDGANLLIGHLYASEMKDDIEAVLRLAGDDQKSSVKPIIAANGKPIDDDHDIVYLSR